VHGKNIAEYSKFATSVQKTFSMKSAEEIKEFYDNDTRQKFHIRNNLRHYIVISKLIELGLNSRSKVLEIGCGNGGVTRLIADVASKGKVTAVDISPECVNAAKSNLKSYNNIEYVVSDMSDYSSAEKVDFIVLPDVLEHIPIDQHGNLFRVMRSVLDINGIIFVHIPEPKFLEWQIKTMPEALQIIDQPLHADSITSVAYPNGLYLRELKSYCMYRENEDYQYMVFTRRDATYAYKKLPDWKVILKKRYYALRSKL
jgi:2-polyprenyl-3-methyl-5-hydroxy-6-metoxy-1,4-benzoquinol methylase